MTPAPSIRMAILDDALEVLELFALSVQKYNEDPGHDPKIDLLVFSNSYDFLSSYEKRPFDVVLLDLNLNGDELQGPEVHARMQKISPLKSVVLMETGNLQIPPEDDSWLRKERMTAEEVMARFERLRRDIAMNLLEVNVRLNELDLVGAGRGI